MGSITTGVGLISGINTAALIDSLITLESAGKFRLQERVAVLQSQQTALLDVNARLLAFKNAAAAFRINKVFDSTLAQSSNDLALTATAGSGAQPGSYKFIVKQLVSTSQQLSGGFASADSNPLGLQSLAFEFGNGRLARDSALEDLNGGAGVDRGRIVIDDGDGNRATIDLTDVTSLNEVLDRINGNGDVDVTASVVDDHLVITDNGGGAELTVSNALGDTTASDLGIAGTTAGGTLDGSSVYYLTGSTALRALNDGNGVLIRNAAAELQITARDGTTFDVDFGRIDLDIDSDTLLDELNDGDGITIDEDSDTADIKFVARDGTEYEVDLTGVTTVGQLQTRISSATSGHIALQVTDGDHFKVVDVLTPLESGNLRILGTDDSGTAAAEDLGILNEDGVASAEYEGTIVPSTIDKPAATTLQEIVDRVNDAIGNDGKVIASIAADGRRLQVEDLTGATASNLIVASTANNTTAYDLGIEQSVAGSTITGERIFGGLDSTLIRNLIGGAGLAGATDVTFTDREGDSFTLIGVDQYETLEELVTAINEEAVINDVQITVGLNETGNGLKVTDTSDGAGNLRVSSADLTAQILGIEGDVASDTITGKNLQLKYVSSGTSLSDLNYGRGVAAGSFRITDGLGQTATVTVGSNLQTVQDLVELINSRNIAVQARINDNGDGIVIEEDTAALGGQSPFVKIKVEGAGGSTASDLNIVGEAADLEGGFIDGAYEHVVDLDASDSLDDVVAKINAAGVPVSASVLNTSSSSTPFRLNITSSITGRAGDLVIDTNGIDLGFSALSEGRDAKVFFGADDPEDGFLITSSTNTLDEVLEGVTIDLHEASDTPVTVTISRNDAAVVGAVGQMVAAFNEVIAAIDSYDFYDSETEERGLLLGDPTVARIRSSLYRVAGGRGLNVGGDHQFLSQVGIRFNSDGEMTLDEAAFRQAYESDRESIEALFSDYDVTAGGTEEIVDGVTIDRSDLTFNALGFGPLFDNLLDDLTNSVDGVTTLAEDAFGDQIELLNDRIETIDERLNERRARLTREFTAMETVLVRLQGQSNSLVSLAANVNLASVSFGIGG